MFPALNLSRRKTKKPRSAVHRPGAGSTKRTQAAPSTNRGAMNQSSHKDGLVLELGEKRGRLQPGSDLGQNSYVLEPRQSKRDLEKVGFT